METTISLQKHLETTTQCEFALQIGVTQSAVSQMLRSGRDIYVTRYADGRVEAYEHHRLGNAS